MHTRLPLRRLATAVAVSAAAVLTTLTFATPAHAADTVDVNLSGVPGSFTAGSRGAANLSGTFQNRGNAAITSIQAVFTIHLDGMPPDGVRVVRLTGGELNAQSSGAGTVTFTDNNSFELPRNGRRTVYYALQFTATAPSGKASITLEAYSGGSRLGGDDASTTVKGNAAPVTASPSPSPSNTNTGIQPTFTNGPSYSLANPADGGDNASSDASTVPVSLYVMGGLLIAVGAVILYLLFRRQKPIAEVATTTYPVYDQTRPMSLGYPRQPESHPTAVLPTVRDAEPPTLPGPPPSYPHR